MTKKMTCIECPKGCLLSVDIENCRVVKVSGNECPKGEKYAHMEVENPMRVLTTSVLSQGLPLKMIPVRTDKPISKSMLLAAMDKIKSIVIDEPVVPGSIVMENILDTGANLVVTRPSA